MDEKEEPMPAE
jgi:hypothetical protein